jgi:hypothetical protein
MKVTRTGVEPETTRDKYKNKRIGSAQEVLGLKTNNTCKDRRMITMVYFRMHTYVDYYDF